MKRRVLAQLSTVLLASLTVYSCAPVTVQSVRENPKEAYTVEVDQRYQDVFANVLKQMKVCYLNQPTSTQLAVHGGRNNFAHTGQITVKNLYGPLNEEVFLLVDIKALGDAKSSVTTSYQLRSARKGALAVKDWVANGSTACTAS